MAPLTLAPPSAMADDSQVTVAAPGGGSVTVEKTKNLINEVVTVTWEGFRPSDNPVSDSPVFSRDYTRFPVRVYQCRTADPAEPGDCYGSDIYEYPGREGADDYDYIVPNGLLSTPDGPFNRVDAATRADGSGGVEIEVMTDVQSTSLGCSESVACSLVVVPNYGVEDRPDPLYPDYPACATVYSQSAADPFCEAAPVLSNSIDAPWAWANRVVVPLELAPAADSCDVSSSAFSLAGAPKAERAITSWQGFTCSSATPLNVSYTNLSELQARSSFLGGSLDVALTDRPVDASLISDDTRKFAYAPISTSSVAVAFRVDDQATGEQIQDMLLNPRLIVKLLTESYGYVGWSADPDYGNPAVTGNPMFLFSDPEFLELNPGVNWPPTYGINIGDPRCSTPILLADISDMTYELTRFLAADPDASAFLEGEADEWGMRINSNFADMAPYPTSTFELRDPYELLVAAFQPVAGLNAVARKLATNSYAGRKYVGGVVQYERCGTGATGYENPGARSFVAIVDSANASAYRFPLARILTGAGDYVAPTPESMALAVDQMVLNEDGVTLSPDPASTGTGAYPLTLIDYAMVPIAGVETEKAEQIARFLDYAADAGQASAVYGGLPGGYLPLGSDLVEQTEAAAASVRAQDGIVPTPTPAPSGSATIPPSGSTNGSNSGTGVVVPPAANGAIPTPAAGAVPGAGAPTGGAVPTTSAPALGGFRPVSSQTPGWLSVALPVVLFAGLAAAALGALGSVLLARGGLAVPRMPWQRRPADRTTKPVK